MAPGAPQEDVLEGGEAPQSPQEREEARARLREEDGGVEEADEEEAPSHLPFAPSSELLDDTTTVDPSYTISLIRQLLPQGSNVEKEFSVKQGVPEEKDARSSNGESAQPDYKDPWEECGCILWDLAVSKPQAELMMNNLVLEVLLANLHVTQSPRVKEICLGILGNLACHESLVNAISLHNGLTATVVDQLFLDDSACLSEIFRFLAAVLRTSVSDSLAEALLPDEILSRILWIVGNTLNSTLLEKLQKNFPSPCVFSIPLAGDAVLAARLCKLIIENSMETASNVLPPSQIVIDFLSTVIDNQDVTTILLQPLIKVGLINHTISLLASEIEKLSNEGKLDRSDSLDLILNFIEELSAIDSCSGVMSQSDQLIQVLENIVKLPDKFEVTSYCAYVVIILANILSDGKHIVPRLSHDLPFLEGLFDILLLVSDDNQARNALWCILACLLAQAQQINMTSLSFENFVSLLLGRFTHIKDDLESHRVDKKELSAEDAYLKHGVSTSLRAICCVMERWIAEKSSLDEEDASLTESTLVDARHLLNYCQNYDP